MGMSRYCEWNGGDTTYANLGITGACTSHCNSYCAGYRPFQDTNAPYPNGCFKCYGMYPGFYEGSANPYAKDPYMPAYAFDGPCTA